MENNQIIHQIIDILLPILATFLTTVFAVLGTKIKNTYEQSFNTHTAQAVVDDVVRFVQQVYADLDGQEKLKKAIEQASIILESKGIKITEAEINMLIESAVFGLKQGITQQELLQAQTKQISTEIEVEETKENEEEKQVASKKKLVNKK